ncbi:DNA-3-methyladenine glycosylase II [Actinomycetospora succinea]|uniref:DNA-3-methyladenine glycosylase II n=1 Tax=Actinomycetospora succinea TaxID=663603 RepID=A0A4V3DA90_9PSEU|nr:AlkA N-terminal domain-containing protein [Actinomycetospora succinea]TDQ60968.1 DNA-3-methyladenine glycosylase II [Actinomycetospora succinea]
MIQDVQGCLRAVRARDARFDGWFYFAVTTTGIYCRPSCSSAPPKASNVRFFASSAAAQQGGFRACKRCRPDTSPGSPHWNERGDVVARAMRLIADGVVDRDGVTGLAAQLGYSTRQVERQVRAELGAGPAAIARAQRAQTARTLIETTALPMTEIAAAAGFASIRAFNGTLKEVYASTPTELRRRTVPADSETSEAPGAPAPALRLRLPVRVPFAADALFDHLGREAVAGVEEWRDGVYRRSVRLPHGVAVVSLRPFDDHVSCRLTLQDLRDLPQAIHRCRRLLDLDADPVAIDEVLAADPSLAALIARRPGLRMPQTVDPRELALRVALGQHLSESASSAHCARLVAVHGDRLPDGFDPQGTLTHLFPTPESLSACAPHVRALPAPRALVMDALIAALAEGEIELGLGADREQARAQLAALPDLGASAGELIAMRALGDPDAFPPNEPSLRAAAHRAGVTGTPSLDDRSPRWAPWRAYAAEHLWAAAAEDRDVARSGRTGLEPDEGE